MDHMMASKQAAGALLAEVERGAGALIAARVAAWLHRTSQGTGLDEHLPRLVARAVETSTNPKALAALWNLLIPCARTAALASALEALCEAQAEELVWHLHPGLELAQDADGTRRALVRPVEIDKLVWEFLPQQAYLPATLLPR